MSTKNQSSCEGVSTPSSTNIPTISFNPTKDRLRVTLQTLSDFIESHVGITGDAVFSITDVIQLRSLVEKMECDVRELEKINSYNESSSQYTPPIYREIKGKAPCEKNDDRVNHLSHYTWLKDCCGIEVIDITRHMDFNLGNVIKYVLRSGRKTEEGISNKKKEVEDLRKAIFYLNDEIHRIITTNNKQN